MFLPNSQNSGKGDGEKALRKAVAKAEVVVVGKPPRWWTKPLALLLGFLVLAALVFASMMYFEASRYVLIHDLGDEDPLVADAARDKLRSLGSDALALLEEAFSHPRHPSGWTQMKHELLGWTFRDLRRQAVRLAYEIAEPAEVRKIALSHPDFVVREEALRAEALLLEDAPISETLTLISDREREVRGAAMFYLCGFEDDESVRVLAENFEKADNKIELLRSMKSRASLRFLQIVLDSKDETASVQALVILASRRETIALTRLVHGYGDPEIEASFGKNEKLFARNPVLEAEIFEIRKYETRAAEGSLFGEMPRIRGTNLENQTARVSTVEERIGRAIMKDIILGYREAGAREVLSQSFDHERYYLLGELIAPEYRLEATLYFVMELQGGNEQRKARARSMLREITGQIFHNDDDWMEYYRMRLAEAKESEENP
ncbi:MAG: hypothetical protein NUW37_17110 [Planctomycetes bacterium]|nr:hypothetical protein [Planctomycetota bacterium]